MRIPAAPTPLHLVCFLAALVLGSPLARTHAQTKRDSQKPPPKLQNSTDIEADLTKERTRVDSNVNLAKRRLEKDLDAMAKVKLKYNEARNAVQLLVEDIQRSIRDGKDPKRSKLYAKRAKEAESAIALFNEHVEIALMDPKDRPKFLPLLVPLIGSLADVLWKNIDESRKASAAERKARREEMAEELERLKFREFDKVPQ